jgi:hypothetical protein
MNNNLFQKLLSLLPAGPKKDELVAKYLKAQQGAKAKDGLHDVFEFKAAGHIKIEQIDASGNVVGVLADQANLVVNGAEEILLRAFSGDPDKMLYKIRIPKNAGDLGTTPTKRFYASLDAITETGTDGTVRLKYAPNEYWKAVDDSEFNISYSYRPQIVYLREETSDVAGKKAFRIYFKAPSPSGYYPLISEIHSSQTNLFIGIGDGENYAVDLADSRLTYSAGWATDSAGKKTSTLDDSIVFNQKISNFVLGYQASDKSGAFEVYVNDVLKETVDAYDSAAAVPVAKTFSMKGLDHEELQKIEIKFVGTDQVTGSSLVVTAIRFDALAKNMSGLIHELENFTTSFQTQTAYNTTNQAPFTIQLANFPVKANTLSIYYEGQLYEKVGTKSEVAEGKYFLDDKAGVVHFNRTLSGLMVAYDTTGEFVLLKPLSAVQSITFQRDIKNDQLARVNSSNKNLVLSAIPYTSGLVLKKVNGATVTPLTTSDYTITDPVQGTITLNVGLAESEYVLADYRSNIPAKALTVETDVEKARGFDFNTQTQLTFVTEAKSFGDGKICVDPANKKRIIFSDKRATGEAIQDFEILYNTPAAPGAVTGYTRQVIEKPKAGIAYPWYQLDKGSVAFITEFPENVPNYNVTIREMILANGPRLDDKIDGFTNYPVDAFSIVRVGDTRKEVSTGVRITWTITLLNKDGDPFYGGY